MAGFDSTQLDIVIAAKFLAGPAFQQAQTSLEGIRKSQEQMAAGMAQASNAMGMMGTVLRAIPFAAAYAGLSQLHSGTVQLAASINDQSEALGLSTRHYQALQIAAQGAGIAEGQMASILTHFNAKIGEAVAGKKEAIAAFDALGVKLLDSQGKLRGEGAVLQEVAAKLAGMSDVTERTTRAKELLGIAGAKATAMLKDLAIGYDGLAVSGERAGLIMDQKTIETLSKLDRAGTDLTRTIQVLYGQFAAPIITTALDAVDASLKRIKSSIDGIGSSWSALPDLLLTIFRAQITMGGSLLAPLPALSSVIGGGGGGGMQGMEARIASLEKERADFVASPGHGPNSAPVTMIDREIADIRRQLAMGREGARGGNIPWAPNQGSGQPVVKPSGGGGSHRDVLGALQAESQQLADSYQRVMGFSTTTTQEMRDQAELADKIAKRLASALKDVPEGDPKRGQIIALIEQNERYRQSIDLRQKALKEADAIEKRSGDGEREHTEAMRKLKEMFDLGLISQQAYTGETLRLNDALAAQRDRVAEARGGLQGFTAGFSSSARAYEKANTTFRLGQQLFEGSVSIMSSALEQFAATGEFSFKRVANAFADMLLSMAAKQAASGLMDILGSLFSSVLGGIGSGVSGTAAGDVHIGGRASGGGVSMGTPYIVGENGPELMVPGVSGTIFNQDQIGGMGGGVNVTQHITIGNSVNTMSRVDIMAALRRTKNETMAAIVDAKRRGGLRGSFA